MCACAHVHVWAHVFPGLYRERQGEKEEEESILIGATLGTS